MNAGTPKLPQTTLAPKEDDAAVQKAEADERRRARTRKGARSMNLTGGSGLTDPAPVAKTYLGQ